MQSFTVISPMSILINFVQKKSQNYVCSVVISLKVKVKVAQSCLTFCNPMDYPWNSLGQNTGVGSLSQLQGIFPTRIKPRSPALHWILHQLRHNGSPRILEWVA